MYAGKRARARLHADRSSAIRVCRRSSASIKKWQRIGGVFSGTKCQGIEGFPSSPSVWTTSGIFGGAPNPIYIHVRKRRDRVTAVRYSTAMQMDFDVCNRARLSRDLRFDGRLRLDAASPLDETIRTLCQIPGIGEWTAQYIAMRALREPDAFLSGDLGVSRGIALLEGPMNRSSITARSAAWRPWRAYAVMYLWTYGEEQS